MGLDTEEIMVSSNYTISECASCHMTATFAGNGNCLPKCRATSSGGSPYTEAHHIALVKSKVATSGKVGILFDFRYARKVTA
jgi:hypothetical protein